MYVYIYIYIYIYTHIYIYIYIHTHVVYMSRILRFESSPGMCIVAACGKAVS